MDEGLTKIPCRKWQPLSGRALFYTREFVTAPFVVLLEERFSLQQLFNTLLLVSRPTLIKMPCEMHLNSSETSVNIVVIEHLSSIALGNRFGHCW